jgi:hypothetical protein
MRCFATLFALTLMLFSNLLTAAAPAAAAPAQPVSFDECWSGPDWGDGYEYCLWGQYVIVRNTTPSGNILIVENGNLCNRYSYLGEVLSEACGNSHQTFVVTPEDYSGPSLNNYLGFGEFSYVSGGITYTCTNYVHAVVANNVIQIDDQQLVCTPPV